MLKATAVAHYGSQRALAEAVGKSAVTVSEWGRIVPLGMAFVIHAATGLPVDLSVYEDDDIPPILLPMRDAAMRSQKSSRRSAR